MSSSTAIAYKVRSYQARRVYLGWEIILCKKMPIICWQRYEEENIKLQGNKIEGLKQLIGIHTKIVKQICKRFKSKGYNKPQYWLSQQKC